MSENTAIEWADHTFNPWLGCTKVSLQATGGGGCDNCYAEKSTPVRIQRSQGRETWGPGAPRVRTKNWNDPVRWNATPYFECTACGRRGTREHMVGDANPADSGNCHCELHMQPTRQRVFCASLADVFDNEVPTQWRMDLFSLIAATPKLDWMLLTKRIGNVMPMCSGDSLMFDLICERIWLGATIVNQAEADRDIPKLLAIPAHKRFLSMEPLLGAVDLSHLNDGKENHEINCLKPSTWEEEIAIWRGTEEGWEESFEDHYGKAPTDALQGDMHDKVDWVIVGGESGPTARPMHPQWVKSLRDQCQAAGTAFLFKQWGEWTPGVNVTGKQGTVPVATLGNGGWQIANADLASSDGHADDEPDLYRVGKKAAGRQLDGTTWDGYPTKAITSPTTTQDVLR